MASKTSLRPRRLMSGPYLARNPFVLGMMAAGDVAGLMAPRRAAALPDRPLSVLVANLAHLGDLVNIIPMLARLRASPRVKKLGVVVGTWGRPVFELGNFADRVHVYDHWRFHRGGEHLKAKLRRHAQTRASALGEIRTEGYDAAIDTYAYFGNSASLLWSAGIPLRAGLTSGGAGTLYTDRFPFDPKLSLARNQARLLQPILGEGSDQGLTALIPPGFQADPEAVRAAANSGRFIIFHLGPGRPEKNWPFAAWIKLGRRLTADGFRIVFTGSASEGSHGAEVRATLGGEDLVGRFGLRGFATLLSRCEGLVTIDTLAAHLAACFQTPTVVVSPGIVPRNLWHPDQNYALVATHSIGCAPCNRTKGCGAMTCIRAIPAERVYLMLHKVISAKLQSSTGHRLSYVAETAIDGVGCRSKPADCQVAWS
jgi:ADP-heptose:LPS heptosyltransferase